MALREIDFELLETLFAKMNGKVPYKLGGKAKLGDDSNDIESIDCSGFTRWILNRVSGLVIPDGSQNQLQWARDNCRKLAKYADVEYARNDPSRLFMGFLSPTRDQERKNAQDGRARGRHVWLVWKGRTLESSGGRGVNSKPWKVYKDGCKECFEL